MGGVFAPAAGRRVPTRPAQLPEIPSPTAGIALVMDGRMESLIAIGGLLPFVCRLESVRARLAWWQMLLGTCLLLPLIQPWKQAVIYSSSVLAPLAATVPVHLTPAAAPFPWEKLVLLVLGAHVPLTGKRAPRVVPVRNVNVSTRLGDV